MYVAIYAIYCRMFRNARKKYEMLSDANIA